MSISSELLTARILAPLAHTLREATERLGLNVNGEAMDEDPQAAGFAPDFAAAAAVTGERAAPSAAASRSSQQGGADSASADASAAATSNASAPGDAAAAAAAPAGHTAPTAAKPPAAAQFPGRSNAAPASVAAAAQGADVSATATQAQKATDAKVVPAFGDAAVDAAPRASVGASPGIDAESTSGSGRTAPHSAIERGLPISPRVDDGRESAPVSDRPASPPAAGRRVASAAPSPRMAAVRTPAPQPTEDVPSPRRAAVLASRNTLSARAAAARTSGLSRAISTAAYTQALVAAPSGANRSVATDSAQFMLPQEVRNDSAVVAADAVSIQSQQAGWVAAARPMTAPSQGAVPVRRVHAAQAANAESVAAPALDAATAPARLPVTRHSAARRVAGALEPTLDRAYDATNRALARDVEGRAGADSEPAAESAPAPQVSNTFNVNVDLRGDEGTAAADREALRDALVAVLRESARRQGLDV